MWADRVQKPSCMQRVWTYIRGQFAKLIFSQSGSRIRRAHRNIHAPPSHVAANSRTPQTHSHKPKKPNGTRSNYYIFLHGSCNTLHTWRGRGSCSVYIHTYTLMNLCDVLSHTAVMSIRCFDRKGLRQLQKRFCSWWRPSWSKHLTIVTVHCFYVKAQYHSSSHYTYLHQLNIHIIITSSGAHWKLGHVDGRYMMVFHNIQDMRACRCTYR